MKMSNAPIFYTLGQIRFNSVLNMSDFVPRIHERIRKQFPAVKHEELKRVQLNLVGQDPKDALSTFNAPRWTFTDLKNTSGYILQPDSIIFHTTAYETSQEFYAALIDGLKLVDEIVGLSFVEGIGVRTLDAVVPSEGQSLRHYLKEQVLGFHDLVDGELRHNITENVSVLLTGQQVSRVVILRGPIGIPADLFPISLTLDSKFQNVNDLHAIVDLDHSYQVRFEFDLNEVDSRVREVKQAVSAVFKNVVTSQAIEEWNRS